MSTYKTSRAINGYLVFFYLVPYSLLEVLYSFFIFRTPFKEEDASKYKEFRKVKMSEYIEYVEASLHGTMIIISLFFNLAGAKVNNVKIFQI